MPSLGSKIIQIQFIRSYYNGNCPDKQPTIVQIIITVMELIGNSQKILTLIGSCLINIVFALSSVWGATNIYYLSYFYNRGDNISENTNSEIIIVTVVPLSVILIFSTKICEKLGYIYTIKVCSAIFFLSQAFIYLAFDLLIFVIFTLIIPISCLSVSLIPTLNLLWSHYHDKKSIVMAVNMLFLGLGTILWNVLFMVLVNPSNQQAFVTPDGDAYFNKDVSNNVQFATKLILFISSLIYIVGAFMIRELPKSEENSKQQIIAGGHLEKKQKTLQQQHDQIRERAPETCERSIFNPKGSDEKIDLPVENAKQQLDQQAPLDISQICSGTIKQAIKDKRCLLIFLLLIIVDIYPNYLLNNFKVIYMPIIDNDEYLQMCVTINSIANILGTFIWGYLGHKLGVIKTITVVVVFGLLGGILGFFSQDPVILVIFIVIFGLGDRGMETIAGPALVEIFGLKTATLLLPYKGLSLLIGFLISPIFQILTSKFLDAFSQLSFLFFFCVISFFVGIYYTKKYNKQDDQEFDDKQIKEKPENKEEYNNAKTIKQQAQLNGKIDHLTENQ